MNDDVQKKSVVSPGSKAEEIPLVGLFLSVLRIITDFAPRPGVKGTG
jgi:hypothetical protein